LSETSEQLFPSQANDQWNLFLPASRLSLLTDFSSGSTERKDNIGFGLVSDIAITKIGTANEKCTDPSHRANRPNDEPLDLPSHRRAAGDEPPTRGVAAAAKAAASNG
jgi:hypothetical protein